VTERSHIAARTARADAFAERLLARARSRIGEASPLEMTLRRTGPVLVRVAAAAPINVSHHHRSLAIHVALALPGVARERVRMMERSDALRPISSIVLRRVEPVARAVAASSPPTVLVRASRASDPTAMRRVTALASTVATTVRRDESVRVETVVRRSQAEVRSVARSSASASVSSASSPSATSMSSPTASPGATFEARRSSPPAAQPVALADVDIGRLADRVVQRIQRRVNAQRERMGG
jgi:hypothetical protein